MRNKLLLLALVAGLVFWGHASASALPKLCSMSPAYRAVYQYPTGSYWVNQIAHYPAYYSTNNAYYQAKYGC